MHLINAETRELETFEGENIPAYAVLSHTWGAAQEEILFQDLTGTRTWDPTAGPPQDSPKAVGWKKLSGACRQALSDSLHYIWIDTCCIDKSSSAELSEAINTMFRWYANSVVCYAYLADVYAGTNPRSDQAVEDFRKSRWFTRGWTLQEFLAPADVTFFDARWVHLGGKYLLREIISTITGINTKYMGLPIFFNRSGWDPHQVIATASVAEKMSWAAARQTTRVEDKAYCLLGIFNTSMPMLYGEGDRAFARLQENIMVASEDCTLLAWNYQVSWPQLSAAWNEMRPPLLAPSPAAFRHCRDLIPRKIPRHTRPTFSMTQRGLKLKAPIVTDRSHKELAYAILACGPLNPPLSSTATPGAGDVHLSFMALPLISGTPASDSDAEEYWRPAWCRPTLVTRDFILGTVGAKPRAIWKKIIIRRPSSEHDLVPKPRLPFSLVTSSPDTDGIFHAHPPYCITFRRVVIGHETMSADATGPGSLLDKLRRGSRQNSSSIATEKTNCQSSHARRVVYAKIMDLDILIHLQYGAASIPSDNFLQKLGALEWPQTPQVKVYLLPACPSLEDLQEWYEAKLRLNKLTELSPLDVSRWGPSDTERLYTCEGRDGKPEHFRLAIGFQFRQHGDRVGEVSTWELMPVLEVSYDKEEEADEADAWSVAETLTQG